jgi:hypothetical protein
MNAAMRRWGGLAALVLVFGLGTESTAMATSAVTGSTKLVKVRAVGLSLRYPAAWTVVPTQRLSPQALKRLRKSNPKAAALFDQGIQDQIAKGTKFTARDLDAEFRGDPAGKVLVAAVPHTGFPGSLDEFNQYANTIAQNAHGVLLLVGPRHIGGKNSYELAIRLTLTAPSGRSATMRTGELLVPEGDGAAIVGATSTDDAAGQAVIDGILGSVHRT